MERLDKNTRSLVYDYFTIVELIEIKWTSKFFRAIELASIFRQRLIKNMSRVCQVSVSQANTLLTKCIRNNCVISGSIILQTLYSEVFDDYKQHGMYGKMFVHKTDLDIFVNHNSKEYPGAKILLNRIMGVSDTYSCPNPIQSNYMKCKINDVKNNFNVIYNFKATSYNTKHGWFECVPYSNVQVISVNRSPSATLHQVATDDFDMTIVMNSFSANGLEVHNSEYLFKRKNNCVLHVSDLRKEKYTSRGFEIQNKCYKPSFGCNTSWGINLFKTDKFIVELLRKHIFMNS